MLNNKSSLAKGSKDSQLYFFFFFSPSDDNKIVHKFKNELCIDIHANIIKHYLALLCHYN